MRNYFENDDPIQEVGRKSIFGRVKSFEESDEYNFEKEMEEYEKSFSKEQNINNVNRNININHQVSTTSNEFSNLIIIISIFIIISPLIYMVYWAWDFSNSYIEIKELPIETSLGEEDPVLEDEFDLQIYYKLTSIEFDKAGSIVALYKFDKDTVANWCNFTESDKRFNGLVNTFQINYDYIPNVSRQKLKEGLELRKFEHIKEYPTGSVYAINKENGYFLFVLISAENLIYGSAGGKYQDVFGE